MNDYPHNLELATKEQLLDMLKSLGIITFNDYEKHKEYSEDLISQLERWRNEEEKTKKRREELKKEIDEWQKKNAELQNKLNESKKE